MSGFQRMIAIPQEEYIQLKSMQYVNAPEAQKMAELAQVYQQQQTQIKDPHEQMILQGATLDHMKDLKEKLRQDLSLGTPKPYRNRALSLFRSIEPHVKFNERGEIYGDDDKPIEHSRAEDLIQHAVRTHRRHFTPLAWDYFLNLLKKHNVPRSILNRYTLEELDGYPKPVRKRLSVSPFFKAPPMDLLTSPPQKKRKTSQRLRTPSSRYPSPDFLKDFK